MTQMRRLAVLSFIALTLSFAAGCGSGGAVAVSTSGAISFSATSATVTFANTSVGTPAGAQSVTVTNISGSTLSFTTVLLTGNNHSDFSMTGSCVGITSLAAGASCSLSVNFVPTATGARTAIINFQDSTGISHTLTLNGTATASLADFSPSPGALLFPVTVMSTPSAPLTLTFENDGLGADTVSGVAISGPNAADFSQTNNCTTIAASGGTCTINVTFTPSTTGSEAATLTVTDNSNGALGTTHTATLAGSAVASAAPTVTLSTSTLSFTSSSSQPVTVTNTGAVAVSITGITITGTNQALYSQTNDCSTSIAVGGSCTVSVTFAPGSTTGSTSATLNIADNATGTPQTVGLSGTATPVITFLPTALTLTEATLSTISPAQTVKLTNTGTASMTTPTVAITGTNAARFAISSNGCTGTLAVNANCSVSVTFTPTANGTVTASLTFTDTATGSPQTVPLTGNGPGAATTTMTLVTVPDDTYPLSATTFTQVDSFINSATSTIDMTIYELTDATMIADLVTQCHTNGVQVRVNLDNSEKSTNQSAHDTIVAGGANCLAQFSNTHFPNTHEKSVVIDSAISSKARLLISTGNFELGSNHSCGTGCTYNFYATGRDFQLYENDANDVAAWETTFNEDWAFPAGTTYPTSPRFTPPTGDDLVWSPSLDLANSRTAIGNIIANATTTLVVDQEEMSAAVCYNALEAAAQRGVSVKLTTPADAFDASPTKMTTLANLKSAGVQVNQYPSTGDFLYIHAKVIVADAGTANEKAFLGSENCSDNSLSSNRELGIVLSDASSPNAASIISTLNTKLLADFACTSMAPTQTTASCQ
jgi:hypothetical protein